MPTSRAASGETRNSACASTACSAPARPRSQRNSDQRALAVLGLDFRGDHARLSADLGYQYQYVGGMIPYLGLRQRRAAALGARRAQQSGASRGAASAARTCSASSAARSTFPSSITAYAAFGAHDFRLGSVSGGPIVTASNFNGTATATPSNISQYYQFLTGETGVREPGRHRPDRPRVRRGRHDVPADDRHRHRQRHALHDQHLQPQHHRAAADSRRAPPTRPAR